MDRWKIALGVAEEVPDNMVCHCDTVGTKILPYMVVEEELVDYADDTMVLEEEEEEQEQEQKECMVSV
jgi:hypothetical protein